MLIITFVILKKFEPLNFFYIDLFVKKVLLIKSNQSTLNNSIKTILLFDSTLDIKEIQNHQFYEIITFDYDSHILLLKNKIPHKISDNFIPLKLLNKFENKMYDFTKWYEINDFSQIIIIDGINLGELFYFEFRKQFVEFFKKFLELTQIIASYPNFNFLASDTIYDIFKPLTNNIQKIVSKTEKMSIFNYVDVPLKIGPKIFTIKLTRKQVAKISTVLNKICQTFLLRKKINKNYDTVLLVNFSTLKNENFLLATSNAKLNIIKYDRSLPSIWNKKTLNIIRKSNTISENESTISNNNTLQKIKELENFFNLRLEQLMEHESLENFFSLENSTFWPSLKPLFTRICKHQFTKAAREIELTTNLFKKFSFSKIVLFNESNIVEQIIINFAKKQQIPVILAQHGLHFDTNERYTENYFQRVIPKNSDYFLAWGNSFKNYLINNHIESDKIKVIGSSFFDKLFQTKNLSSYNSENILLASDPLAFNRIIDLSIHQKELYRNTIEKICKIVSQNDKKLIIKTHPQKNQHEQEIAKKIDPNIKVFYSGDIHELIKLSDLVIATDVTTVILEAMIMQKPVISIRIKEHYGKLEIFNYCTQIPLNSLDSWIESFYNDSEIRNKMIIEGNKFLKIYFENQGNASNEILKFLET
jgi:hypothetical protein